MRKPLGKKGFTLIEMIISVALLAVAGTAVASLFMNAQINNRKAHDLDQSTARLSAWIEEIKASPEIRIDGEPSSDEALLIFNGQGSYKTYYDGEWQPILNENETSAKAEFAIVIDLYEMPDKPGLWTLEARSVKLKPYFLGKESNIEILKLSAMVEYFGEVAP